MRLLITIRFRAHDKVFGLGMAGRVVVEGAPYPRGLLIEAYIPVCSQRWVIFVPYSHPFRIKLSSKAHVALSRGAFSAPDLGSAASVWPISGTLHRCSTGTVHGHAASGEHEWPWE